MTNAEIITRAAVAAGIITEKDAENVVMHGMELPLHTFAEWNKRGYSVKKGEHAALKTEIWNYAQGKKKKESKKEENAEEETAGHYYIKTAYFFTRAQVEAIK